MSLGDIPTINGSSEEGALNSAAQGLWDRIAERDQAPSAAAPPAPQPAADVPAAPAKAEEAPTSSVEAAADSSSDEVEYSDLDDYLTKAKLERDSFLSLPVKLKVDGKDEQATLKELLEAGQLRKHAQLETQKVSERQKQWESERTAAQQAIATQWQQAQALATFAKQQLFAEAEVAIKNNDLAKLHELQMKDNAINGQIAQFQQAQQAQLQQMIHAERTKMFEAMPDWRDQAKFQTAQTQITSYATERGFTPAELSQVVDHRYMRVLADAARVKDLQVEVDTLKAQLAGKTEAAVKKVRAAPQIVSTGARQAPRDPKVVALDSAKDRFMKSGNPDAQAAYAQALLNAGLGA